MRVIGFVAEKPKPEQKPEKVEAPKEVEEKPEKAAPKAKK